MRVININEDEPKHAKKSPDRDDDGNVAGIGIATLNDIVARVSENTNRTSPLPIICKRLVNEFDSFNPWRPCGGGCIATLLVSHSYSQ